MTEMMTNRKFDWMQRCCADTDFGGRGMDTPKSITVDGEIWTMACDGRRLVAVREAADYPNIDGLKTKDMPERYIAIIRGSASKDGYTRIRTTWERLREFIGEAHELVKVACEECRGMGIVTCNYEHEHSCSDCDGEGVVDGHPEPRWVRISGLKFNAVLFAEALMDAPVGDVNLYVRQTTAEVQQEAEMKEKPKVNGVGIYCRSEGRTIALMDSHEDFYANEDESKFPEFDVIGELSS